MSLVPYDGPGPDIQEVPDVGEIAQWRPLPNPMFGAGSGLDLSIAGLDAEIARQQQRRESRRIRDLQAFLEVPDRSAHPLSQDAPSQVSFAPEVQVFPQRPR